MVKEFLRDAGIEINWSGIIAIVALLGVVAATMGFAFSNQTQLRVNTDVIAEMRRQLHVIEGRQDRGLAIQEDHARRLTDIERHDTDTRDIEAKLSERLSRIEARPH